MAVSLLARLAASARVPVFVLVGDGGRARARRLRLDPRVRLVASPRHATVLLVAGGLPEPLRKPAAQVHDQLCPPRGTVLWGADAKGLPFPEPLVVAGGDDPVPAVVRLHRELLTRARASAPTLLPDENPVPWKGVGPHGQGGEGMMGGRPYGRPMAMTDDDVRDGLRLDRLKLSVGPFLPWLPTGLAMDLALQGDVVQQLGFDVTPLTHPDLPEAFVRAARGEVPLAQLELERARHHLEVVSDLLALHGLEALAERTLRLAAGLTPDSAAAIRHLARTLHRTAALRLGTHGVGRLAGDAVAGTGPVARASGRTEDARTRDPSYQGLGFEPVTHQAGDAEARWRQLLAEAAQSCELAARAGDRRRAPGAPLEGPRGPRETSMGSALLRLVARTAVGQAWDELATTLVSVVLDPAAIPPGRYGAGEHEAQEDDDGHGGNQNGGSRAGGEAA